MIGRILRIGRHAETGRCAKFFDKVRQYFRYLIDDYGFSVAREETSRSFDNCLIVLQSSNCRVRVVRDRGTVFVEVGPRSAPDVHRPPSSPNLWFDVSTVVVFLIQESKTGKWEWFYESPDESLEDEAKTDWQLAKTAVKLRPYLNDIFRLFREDVFKQKQKELEEFRQKRMEESWQQVMQKA